MTCVDDFVFDCAILNNLGVCLSGRSRTRQFKHTRCEKYPWCPITFQKHGIVCRLMLLGPCILIYDGEDADTQITAQLLGFVSSAQQEARFCLAQPQVPNITSPIYPSSTKHVGTFCHWVIKYNVRHLQFGTLMDFR